MIGKIVGWIIVGIVALVLGVCALGLWMNDGEDAE